MKPALYVAGGLAFGFAVLGFWWLVQTFLGDTAVFAVLGLILAVQCGLLGFLVYLRRGR
jgi:hypothetical protein